MHSSSQGTLVVRAFGSQSIPEYLTLNVVVGTRNGLALVGDKGPDKQVLHQRTFLQAVHEHTTQICNDASVGGECLHSSSVL